MKMTPGELEAIYTAEAPRLLRIAYFVSGSHGLAEDAVAEAFTRCWRRWRNHPPDAPPAYLRQTLLNVLAKEGRRSGRTAPIDPAPVRDSAADDRVTLLAALAVLPRKQRITIVLRYLDDVSEHDVAELLGVPAGTVKSRAARGLRQLETILRSTYEVSDD